MVMEIGEKFKLIVIFNKHAPNDQGKLSIFLICLLAINVLCRNVCWNLGDFWGRYFYCFIVEVLRHGFVSFTRYTGCKYFPLMWGLSFTAWQYPLMPFLYRISFNSSVCSSRVSADIVMLSTIIFNKHLSRLCIQIFNLPYLYSF